MRVRSKIRTEPIGREPGAYVKTDEEPERTERLLAHPFRLFHQHAGDAFDALHMFWLGRSTGVSVVGVTYDFICFVMMLALGVTYGLEELAEAHGAAAGQAIVAIVLQVGLSAYIFVLRPSVDRLENSQNWFQLLCEGGATLLLVVPVFFLDASEEAVALAAFFGSTVALLIPVALRVYDTIICPLVALRDSGGGLKALGATVLNILLSIPG